MATYRDGIRKGRVGAAQLSQGELGRGVTVDGVDISEHAATTESELRALKGRMTQAESDIALLKKGGK